MEARNVDYYLIGPFHCQDGFTLRADDTYMFHRSGFGFLAFFLALVASGMVLPLFVVSWASGFYHLENELALAGEPVGNTVFANLTSHNPDPAMLPAGVYSEDADTIRMKANYTALPKIGREEAVSEARKFLAVFSYFEASSIVDPGWGTFDFPNWELRLITEWCLVDVYGNALSGKITGYGFSLTNLTEAPPPFNGSLGSNPDLQASESNVYSFLKSANYTLSESCFLAAPQRITRGEEGIEDRFWFRFFHAINGALVVSNEVNVFTQASSGLVVGFGYEWTDVPYLATGRVIEDRLAADNAANYAKEFPSIEVLETNLVFWNLWDSRAPEFVLFWVVTCRRFGEDHVFLVLVYAISGTPYRLVGVPELPDLALLGMGGPSPQATGQETLLVVTALLVSGATSIFSYYLAKRFVR